MSRKIDMTGRKYGRLTVLRECGCKHGEVLWECVCGCGNIVRVPGFDLRSGNTQSCGCYKNEREREANTKHGCKNTRLYHIWKGIGYRSRSAKDKDYGGRGIERCSEWDDFPDFRKWALQSGYNDTLTIERKDVNKGYSPENCTWIPKSMQSRNRRKTIWYKHGEITFKEECVRRGINYHSAYYRLTHGYSMEAALENGR